VVRGCKGGIDIINEFLQKARAHAREVGQNNLRIAGEKGIRFYMGRLLISDGLQELGYSDKSIVLQECLSRYKSGDYGKQPKEDIEINEKAIASGYGDVMGEYIIDGHRIWIKTDLNENTTTTIFLPEEW